MDKNHQLATKIIQQIIYLNLATITPDNKPWNSPVYFAYDKDLNIYWVSWKENQHSLNIKNNPNTFVTIYDSTAPEGTGDGVYFAGQALQITNLKEMLHALKPLYLRKKKSIKNIKYFLNKHPRRIYKFVHKKAWINGEGDIQGNFIDTRIELNLKQLKTLIHNS